MNSSYKLNMFKSSIGISIFSILGTFLGFITQIIMAAYFGTSAEMDAYWVSVTIPMITLAIFIGSLNYTFIPMITENISKGKLEGAWVTINNFINLIFIVLLMTSAILIIFYEDILKYIAPGFSIESKALAFRLFKIQMPSIIITGISSLTSSIYYSHKKFIIPSVASLANSFIMFLTVYVYSSKIGIESAAYGLLLGSIISFLIIIPIVLKHYKFKITFKDEETYKIVKIITPLLFGAIFYRSSGLIQQYFASKTGIGSVSYLGYSGKLITTSSNLIVSGISIVMLSYVSEMKANNDSLRIQNTFDTTFRFLTFIAFPVIIIFIISGKDILNILFQRGKFDSISTNSTWKCLVLYSGVLYGGIIGAVVNPIFYAFKDTMIVVKIGIAGTILQIIISNILVKYLSYTGLPLAYSVSNIITVIMLMAFLNRKYVKIPFKILYTSFIRTTIVSAVVFSIIYLINILLFSVYHPIIRCAINISIIILLYFIISLMVNAPEAKYILHYINKQNLIINESSKMRT